MARKSNARHREIVIAAMEERLSVLADTLTRASAPTSVDDTNPHIARLYELLDELRRSLGNGKETEE